MDRDCRVQDNWALLWAAQEAKSHNKPLWVVYFISDSRITITGTQSRKWSFLLNGLQETTTEFDKVGIPITLFQEEPAQTLPKLVKLVDAHVLVTDFSPLRPKKEAKNKLLNNLVSPFYEVDSHNIVPTWTVSDKKEYGAYTLRPKLNRLLDDYLVHFPSLSPVPIAFNFDSFNEKHLAVIDRNQLRNFEKAHRSGHLEWITPGHKAAQHALETFVAKGLVDYPLLRNNPCVDGQSNLSPYLNFGQLSPQRVALKVSEAQLDEVAKNDFLEELIVRRELSDNFCYYEENYDNFKGFPDWSQKTLALHRKDNRQYTYTIDQLESGTTHSLFWNSCQHNLVNNGKLNGYLRMFWAKKILEWTKEPEEALNCAIQLNDRHSLDGTDPNGYAGVAWSVGGVHDRAWKERPIYGKIRYMNERGCRRKFNVDEYINKSAKSV